MNYIALTGSDMPAMAQAAETLLELVTRECVPAAILLYVNDAATAATLKQAMRPGEVAELWRIGADTEHPQLDPLIDAFLAQADGRCVKAALHGFVRQLPTPAVAFTTSETKPPIDIERRLSLIGATRP
jgi:hypothetical protein